MIEVLVLDVSTQQNRERRTWQRFRLPESVVWVPAPTESQARRQLRETSYKNAPVDAWPWIASVVRSREEIARGDW